MAEQPQSGVVDTSKVPNFAALKDWIEKLTLWCEEAAQERETDDQRITDLEDDLHRAENELADAELRAGLFDELVVMFFDMWRGVRQPEELGRWLRDKGFDESHVA